MKLLTFFLYTYAFLSIKVFSKAFLAGERLLLPGSQFFEVAKAQPGARL